MCWRFAGGFAFSFAGVFAGSFAGGFAGGIAECISGGCAGGFVCGFRGGCVGVFTGGFVGCFPGSLGGFCALFRGRFIINILVNCRPPVGPAKMHPAFREKGESVHHHVKYFKPFAHQSQREPVLL